MNVANHIRYWLAACLACCMALGCGGGEATSPAEDALSNLVADISDASFDEARFNAMFTNGQAPADKERNRYRVFMYRARSLEISGDVATAMVEIEHGTSGEIRGEFPWEFRNEGSQWKLTAAPIPPE